MLKTSLFVILSIITGILYGQGCSDAGACSIESVNFRTPESSQKRRLKLNIEQSFALGEKFVFISQTTAGIQYIVDMKTVIELRVPFLFTSGNLGNTSGVGDPILSLNRRITDNEDKNLHLILATRLRSNDADKSYNDTPLPMAYQTSLGTYDLILGALYSISKWDFYTAYQHSFGRNENEYLVPANTPENKQYYESKFLKRGDDMYFRTRRFLNLKNDNMILLNALFIYRIQKDRIFKDDRDIYLDGSSGITVNLAFTYSKIIKHNRKLEFTIAFPVKDKAYRADGLTRNIVVGIRLTNL